LNLPAKLRKRNDSRQGYSQFFIVSSIFFNYLTDGLCGNGLHFAANCPAFCGKMGCDLPQIVMHFAAKYKPFCGKLQGRFAANHEAILRQIVNYSRASDHVGR